MADHPYEISIEAVDSKGNRSRRELEYIAEAGTTDGAADELVRALVHQRGVSRVRQVDQVNR